MLQTLVSIMGSAYVEIVILIILLIGFFTHRKDPRLVVSGVRFVRTFIVILIFFYFMFIWASAVQPTLRTISVFGMFLLNLFMLYNLILARLERPYRDFLAAITQPPEKHELIHEVWVKGKRFYYLRYAWSSLFSGANPAQFLHTIATERVRNDIKGELRHYGVQQKLISLPMMAGYLKRQAACDENLPADFKDVMIKTIDDFANHPWIEEQANVFLAMVTETPEDLHFPEWMEKFESCVKAYKK
jgi:Ca2+/Na+ antiporter